MANLKRIAVAGLMLAAASAAQAVDMIGDTLHFQRAYPTPATPFWPNDDESTTVAAGSSDLIDWYSNLNATGFHLTVDPGATSIDWRLITRSSFIGDAASPFDGFVITGFSHDITAASIDSNDSNLVLTVSHTAREIRVNMNGSNAGGTTGFVLNVSVVPEPATWVLLAGGTLLVGAMARRRQRR